MTLVPAQLLPESHPDRPWLAAILEAAFGALVERTSRLLAGGEGIRGGGRQELGQSGEAALTTQLSLARALLEASNAAVGPASAAQVSLPVVHALGAALHL